MWVATLCLPAHSHSSAKHIFTPQISGEIQIIRRTIRDARDTIRFPLTNQGTRDTITDGKDGGVEKGTSDRVEQVSSVDTSGIYFLPDGKRIAQSAEYLCGEVQAGEHPSATLPFPSTLSKHEHLHTRIGGSILASEKSTTQTSPSLLYAYMPRRQAAPPFASARSHRLTDAYSRSKIPSTTATTSS